MRAPIRLLRNVLFWLHLSAGVVAGVVILIMSATGAVLAFEQQIKASMNRSYAVASAASAKRLTASEVVEKARVLSPRKGLDPSNVTMYADAGRPVLVGFGREGNVYLDPVTGTGGPEKGAGFFRWNTELHRYVLLAGDARPFGKGVTGVANLMFLFIVLSGAVLWLPPAWKWAVVRLHLVPSVKLRGKTRDWNWHNALGIWALVPLAVIVPAGAVISYKWATDLVYKAAGESAPVPLPAMAARGASTQPAMTLDESVELAGGYFQPWRSMSFTVPKRATDQITFTLDRGTGRQPQHKATLTVWPGTGERVFETAAAKSKGQRWRAFMRFAHTGEYFGLVGQFVGMLACLAACVLVWTGVGLSVRRGWNWWKRGKGGAVVG